MCEDRENQVAFELSVAGGARDVFADESVQSQTIATYRRISMCRSDVLDATSLGAC